MTKILSCAAVAGLLVASSSSVFAGGGASHFITPAVALSLLCRDARDPPLTRPANRCKPVRFLPV
jgi:ABC-type Mn2+/Zn2+ transport system permease subunit